MTTINTEIFSPLQKKKVHTTTEIAGMLRKSGIHTSSGYSNFANIILKNYARMNKPLPFELAYATGLFTLYPFHQNLTKDTELISVFGNPAIAKTQSVAIISSIYNKETMNGATEQLAGIIAAVFDHDIPNSSYGFLSPQSEIICDNCGTGGDNINTFHISTSASFIAAAHGIKMAKHGSPGNAQRSGSTDLVNALGINTMPSPIDLEHSIDETGFAYIEALDTRYKSIHTQTHNFAHLAHMNDIIGPMTNPIDPHKLKIKVLGINQVLELDTVANAYLLLNAKGITNIKRGLVLRGYVEKNKNLTTDEVSIMSGGTEAVLIDGDTTKKINLTHSTFGFKEFARLEEISPPYNTKNGRIGYSIDVLNGKGPIGAINTLLANAAVTIALSMDKIDFALAAKIAEELFYKGKHIEIINRVAGALPSK